MTGTRTVAATAVQRLALGPRVAVVAAGSGALAVALLPRTERVALAAAALAVGALLTAAVAGGRLLGTIAVALTTATVLAAETLAAGSARPVHVVAASAFLLLLLEALDRLEDAEPAPPHAAVTVLSLPLAARLTVPVTGLTAALAIAVVGDREAVPSVAAVIAGVVAALGALVVAIRTHRN